MFHVSVRVASKIARRSTLDSLKTRVWTTDVRSLRQINTTSDVSALRHQVKSAKPSALNEIWNDALEADKSQTLNARFDIYERIRKDGLGDTQFEWCSSIISCLPPEAIRYADFLFAVELLMSLASWKKVQLLLEGIPLGTPVYWEQLLLHVLEKSSDELSAEVCLKMFGDLCAHRNIDITMLDKENVPLLRMCDAIINRFIATDILDALNSISETNMILANHLSSALSRTRSGFLIDPNKAPDPTSKAASVKLEQDAPEDLTDLIWKWKLERSLESAEDLRIYMLHLASSKRCREALRVFDDNIGLHDKLKFNETVLLCAAGAGDYSRLQSIFEEVEQDPALIKKFGSQRYAIVLGALGYLGDAGIVGDIYSNILKSRPELLTKGVYHALIHNHGIRGDFNSARKVYNTMIDRGVKPNYTTFGLMVRVYRDASDLKSALDFVGNEMIARHQHALRNEEFTMLLSLCGRRCDHKSAQIIWEWGKSLCDPDRIAYNTYLHVLLSANSFDDAWKLFAEIGDRFSVKIDLLTIMLNAAGRSKNVELYTSKILETKEELQLKPDEGWYTSLLSALAEIGNLDRFEEVLAEMKSNGLTPTASQYALHLDLLAKSKHFAREDKHSQEMRDTGNPINFAFIEKQLRLLVAPGSSQDSRNSAHAAALTLVREGYFDPSAAMIPRVIIPVRVIQPVVQRLTKLGQYVSAKQLLDGLRNQRKNEPGLRDECAIWALYMEIAETSQNYETISTLWSQFKKTISNLYTLSKPAVMAPSENGNALGRMTVSEKPVFAIAARYRKSFSRPVGIWIRQLERNKDRQAIIDFPKEMDSMGLEMNGANVNDYVIALVSIGEAKLAFKAARAAMLRPPFNLSSRCKASLVSVADQVNYHRFGQLGNVIHLMSKNSRKT